MVTETKQTSITSIAAMPSLRVLPVVRPEYAIGKPYWCLFGCFPKTRDAYRLLCHYNNSDPSVPPTEQEIAESISRMNHGARASDMTFCTDMAVIYGSYCLDMVDQYRAARGRPRRAKRAA